MLCLFTKIYRDGLEHIETRSTIVRWTQIMVSKHKIGFLNIVVSTKKSHCHHYLQCCLGNFCQITKKNAAAQFRMTTAYWQYNSWVPEFLHQRPRPVIAHSLQRIKNCEKEKYTEADIQTFDDIQGLSWHTIMYMPRLGNRSPTM